jgi:radical SAM superfamily enzyme YgiQ (UPF0313 family)
MKVLFIIDNMVVENLGIGYLSSYLKQAGHEVDIIQTEKENLKEKIMSYLPDILAYSLTTGKHNFYKEMDKGIKGWYKTQTVYGGPHVTFFPQFIQGDDIGIRGEGFEAFPELLNRLQNKKEIESMDNLVYHGKINPLRPLLDKVTLLHPDRDLMYKYFANYNNPIKNVMASFFCLFNCGYCFNPKYKEMYGITRSQLRPVGDVISEINDLRLYPLELIFFQDDIFPLYDDKWLSEFCYQYQSIKKPFHIQLRVEMITEERIKKLKDVGLHGVTFAIESGNEAIRNVVLRRRMSNTVIIEGANILHKYGIKLRTENMIGIIGEGWNEVMETVKLNIACKSDIAWASLFQPYPGTELGDRAIKGNLFDGNYDDIDKSFFETYRLKSEFGVQLSRLQKLFSLIVEYPKLIHLAKLLAILPLDSLYMKVYKMVKSYLYQRRLFKCNY